MEDQQAARELLLGLLVPRPKLKLLTKLATNKTVRPGPRGDHGQPVAQIVNQLKMPPILLKVDIAVGMMVMVKSVRIAV